MALHSELLPYRTLFHLVYPCTVLFLFHQPSVELELLKQFHAFQKVRNISRFDWDRQSRMRDYHLSLHTLRKVKTNRPRASQICIGVTFCPVNKDAVAMRCSDWSRAKWDHAYCHRTTAGLDILWQTLGHRVSRRSSGLLWRKPNLDSPCRLQVFLRSLRRVTRKKLA